MSPRRRADASTAVTRAAVRAATVPGDVPTADDYRRLLAFRTGLRQFLHWSEERAGEVGLTPAQHQLLLAVRGWDGDADPTIGELGHVLLLKHHSTVGLVDRAQAAGLVTRVPDPHDGRVVHVRISPRGAAILEELSAQHLAELDRLAPALHDLIRSAQAH
jgi:DNA-binding MarR family transcriptional regulator